MRYNSANVITPADILKGVRGTKHAISIPAFTHGLTSYLAVLVVPGFFWRFVEVERYELLLSP